MACTVAGPHSRIFIPIGIIGILERMQTHTHTHTLTHTHSAEAAV